VGEIAWERVDEPAVSAWGQYESLLNMMFATAPVTFICPYDTRVLGAEIVDVACATHPQLVDRAGVTANSRYRSLSDVLLEG
jgi:MEDS: MEthanogen/methylotroph, DcmR Sensory domain